MGVFVHVLSDEEVTVKACGRACPDMHPLTLPAVPVSPPLSLAALLRAHPDMEFQHAWLAALDAGDTLH